jgi:hypothetical protein
MALWLLLLRVAPSTGIRLEGCRGPAAVIVFERLILDQRTTTGLYRLDAPKGDQVVHGSAALTEVFNGAIDRNENWITHS